MIWIDFLLYVHLWYEFLHAIDSPVILAIYAWWNFELTLTLLFQLFQILRVTQSYPTFDRVLVLLTFLEKFEWVLVLLVILEKFQLSHHLRSESQLELVLLVIWVVVSLIIWLVVVMIIWNNLPPLVGKRVNWTPKFQVG